MAAEEPQGFFSETAFNEAVAEIVELGTDDFIESNKLINYCDTKKDGGINPSVNMIPKFKTQLNTLYSPYTTDADYKPILKAKIEDIMSDPMYGDTHSEELCFMTTVAPLKLEARIAEGRTLYTFEDAEPVLKTLPDSVIYAIQESGYSPHDIKHDILSIVTPASYIDPGSRRKLLMGGTQAYSGFEIPEEVFTSLGFEHAVKSFIGSINPDNSCDITITFSNGTEFNIKRDAYFEHIDTDDHPEDLFLGNKVKNTMIRDLKDDDTIKKIILFKELGDTLQVVYAKLLMGAKNTAVCLFTVDATVTARCRELGVPVSLQFTDTEYANLGKTLYYSLEPAKLEDLIEQHYTNCLRINAVTKDMFNEIAKSENTSIRIVLPSRSITINQAVKDYFRSIAENINEVELELSELKDEALESIRRPELDEDEKLNAVNDFYRDTIKYTAYRNTLSKVSDTEYICSPNITRLFAESDRILKDVLLTGERFHETIRKKNLERGTLRNKRLRGDAILQIEEELRRDEHDDTALGNVARLIGRKRQRGQSGGGNTKEDISYMNEYVELIVYIVFNLLLSNKPDINSTWDTIFMIDEDNKDQKKDPISDLIDDVGSIAFSFINISYIYFNYIRRSCLNEDIITNLIKQFLKNALPSLETFKSYYDSLEVYKKPLMQPPMRTPMKTPIMSKYKTPRRRNPFSPPPLKYAIRTGGRRTQKKRKVKSRTRKNKNKK